MKSIFFSTFFSFLLHVLVFSLVWAYGPLVLGDNGKGFFLLQAHLKSRQKWKNRAKGANPLQNPKSPFFHPSICFTEKKTISIGKNKSSRLKNQSPKSQNPESQNSPPLFLPKRSNPNPFKSLLKSFPLPEHMCPRLWNRRTRKKMQTRPWKKVWKRRPC